MMKNLLKTILAVPLLLCMLSEASAQQIETIDQTYATLQRDLKDKEEFTKFFFDHKKEQAQLQSKFRTELNERRLRLYSQDYQNVFNLASIYKDITTIPRQYEVSMLSIVQIEKVTDIAIKDKERITLLRNNLIAINTTDLPPEIVSKRNKAIDLCDQINALNDKLIEQSKLESSEFQSLNTSIANLKEEGVRLHKIIRKTLTERSITFAAYLRNYKWTVLQVKKALDDAYETTEEENLDRKSTEFRLLIRSLIASAIISIAGAWLIFGVGLRKILNRRKVIAQKSFLILCGSLAFMALCMATLNISGQLDYYKKITALGPEFLITVMLVVLALSARLKGEKFRYGLFLYLPMIMICGVLILLRLITVPDIIVRAFLPVITPLTAILAGFLLYKTKNKGLPRTDRVLAIISLLFLIIGTLVSWIGYSFLTFLLMLFWSILMCSILFIVSFVAIEQNVIKRKEETNGGKESWFVPFSRRLMLPVIGLFMLLFSMFWPMEVFDMGGVFLQRLQGRDQAPVVDNNALALDISPLNIVIIILTGLTISYLVYLGKNALKNNYGDNYERSGIPTLITLGSLIIWGLYVLASMILVKANFNGIFVVLGGMSLGLGFALKDTIENVICGISLMFGQLKQGDYVECDGVRGKVISLGYRTTFIETLDGSIIAFQNTQLFNKNFRNLTSNHMYECCGVEVGVAYATDFDKVKTIIMDAIHNVDLLSKIRSSSVFLDSFGDSSVNIKIYVWVPVNAKGAALSKVREEIYKALNENNIEIPFPQQDIYVKEMPQEQEASDDQQPEKAQA